MADNPAGVPQAVERAVAEALQTIQRQLNDVQASHEQVKQALESARGQESAGFVSLLAPLMHMQARGAALSASIETVLRFVGASSQWTGAPAVTLPAGAPAQPAAAPAETAEAPAAAPVKEPAAAEAPVEAPPPPAAEPVDVDSLSDDMKALHKKAKRFARITVQELMMYHKKEVEQGRQNKDLYQRLKDDIDKSKKLYDERYKQIAGHNIDYLYDELVRTLAENDASALGNYPYGPAS